MTTSFEIPSPPKLTRDFGAEFQRMLDFVNVNEVDHGEFERAADLVIAQSCRIDDAGQRPAAVAIQRCRRGGKTFMLHAVASLLCEKAKLQQHTSQVIFISMNSSTPYDPIREDPYQAITSRVAWELCGREGNFRHFKQKYTDCGVVDEWLTGGDRRIILLIDELNVLDPSADKYTDMSALLDNLVQRLGCALLYSTHNRSTANLLRGRNAGNTNDLTLSKRDHWWTPIPRIQTTKCVQGMLQDSPEQPSFWCAVLRGRIPALLVEKKVIPNFSVGSLVDSASPEERSLCLAAVITGEIDRLPNGRNLFRAYSYMSERFQKGGDDQQQYFSWPPFMIAQSSILGKNYRRFRATLENPDVDEPKAFEAITQLAILVRLMAREHHKLAPLHCDITTACNALEGTEMLHVAESATSLKGILNEVKARFFEAPKVLQVVAVPIFASFPTYDFFLLHRDGNNKWNVVVGYQCKQGTETPSEDAWDDVPTSVWIEGKCRRYRVQDDGRRVQEKLHRGWVMLGESNQADLLGVSVSEALPQDPASSQEERRTCRAEEVWKKRHALTNSQDSAKRQCC